VQERLLRGLGELGEGHVGIDAERGDGALRLAGERERSAAAPGDDRALPQRAPRIGDDALGVDARARADAVAGRAGAVGPVEREHPRLDRRERDAAVDAGEALAHPQGLRALALAGEIDEQAAFAELERQLDRVGEAALHALLHDDAVDDDVEVVDLGAVEDDLVAEVDDLAVDPGADEAFPAQALDLELELAAAGAGDRREDRRARAVAGGEDPVDDLLHRLGLDPLAAAGAVRRTDAGEEEPQVVGDLGDRAHRGARALGQGALLDGDRRREALDRVHVGLGQLLQELARVGGERLDVATLPFGVDRVEGERGFPRAARPGDHDQPIPGEGDADVLEVVLASTPDDQSIHGGRQS
jgi:hypothetical protein